MGDIRYAENEGVFIAYEVLGSGARDLLIVMEGFIPIDTMDDEPRTSAGMRRLAAFARVIRFDRRGIGLSDPVSADAPPTLEQWVADGIAALDAAGSTEAVVLASSEAAPVGLLLAAMHPDRVGAVVIVNGFARASWAEDYPIGLSPDLLAEVLNATNPSASTTEADLEPWAPSVVHDEHFRAWWHAAGRRGASPATARALLRVALEADVRSVLPAIRAPALVVWLRDTQGSSGSRHLAELLPDARASEVAGADDYWWASDAAPEVLAEIEEFVTGVRTGVSPDRRLASLLFTDIVDSTRRTSAMGDAAWRVLLDRHDAIVRRQFVRFGGREINTTGDGFVATFDGPGRAVECAVAVRDAAGQLGVPVRCGVHTGEVEIRGDDVTGFAVDLTARVAAAADAGAIWVTRTVVDLVVGSGLDFADRGEHELKGVPAPWRLFAVE